MKRILLFILVLFFIQSVMAQDSLKVLSLPAFLQIVKKNHPVAKQANLQQNKANASLTSARSGFDPVFSSASGNKTFDGINYYENNITQIVIPIWYGIEVQSGIEFLDGTKTDPQQTLGKSNFTGISVPIAKNLVIDKRRAALKQAKIMVLASDQEKRNMLNDLMMDAVDTYLQWAQSYYIFKIYDDLIEVNKNRTRYVAASSRLGERPAIDTIEAIAQLQNFEYLRNDAWLDVQNATLALNSFLWKENNEAYDLPPGVVTDKKMEALADDVVFQDLAQLISDTKKNHPELNLYQYKLDILNVDKKLKFQELLPVVNLKYNQLGKGYDIGKALTQPYFENNYKFGFNISVPLRLSQGRGEYNLAKLKIAETKLQQNQKEVDIVNKVKTYYNQLVTYKEQTNLLQKMVNNYYRLQQGEETRFLNGEGTLFLLNTRENKTLETKLKFTDLMIKYNKTNYSLLWISGELWKL